MYANRSNGTAWFQTMLFGSYETSGLEDPKTGKRPYAVIQLRQDNAEASLYNIVGFQTHLKWGEQKRVFRMIPDWKMLNSFAMVLCTEIAL